MHTDLPAHPQAFLMMHTGNSQFVRPSLGAWTLYGLGTENENLPGFIALKPLARNGGPQNYGNAFLPAIYQGTRIGNEVVTDRQRPARQHQESPARRRLATAPARSRPVDEPRAARARAGSSRRRRHHRVVRAGVSDAGLAPRGDGHRQRVGFGQEPVRHRRPSRRPTLAASACWPGGSSRRACGLSS